MLKVFLTSIGSHFEFICVTTYARLRTSYLKSLVTGLHIAIALQYGSTACEKWAFAVMKPSNINKYINIIP